MKHPSRFKQVFNIFEFKNYYKVAKKSLNVAHHVKAVDS